MSRSSTLFSDVLDISTHTRYPLGIERFHQKKFITHTVSLLLEAHWDESQQLLNLLGEELYNPFTLIRTVY